MQRQPCVDGKPAGPDRPLEKGVGGIEISKSPQGQPCCRLQWLRLSTFSAAGRLTEFFREPRHHQMPAEEQRSGSPALWCARRPDRSLERESEGLRPLGQSPNEKQDRGR